MDVDEVKKEKHHYTLNHLEDGEVIMLEKENHHALSGYAIMLSNEMSTRRDIMFELLKEIPAEKIEEVLKEVFTELQAKNMLGGIGGGGGYGRRYIKK